jgi:hypothetical protein
VLFGYDSELFKCAGLMEIEELILAAQNEKVAKGGESRQGLERGRAERGDTQISGVLLDKRI